ncbi:MAG TPA: glycosyltransferase family 4 protein [Candidatus Acidoferrum sp.]|nr:glycosyltransferase family 4 protein [Candidatus Acidoferrum sp.]
MKLAIVVHGRFHAFDLSRALLERDHDVTIFTSYPMFAVSRFRVPSENVRSFPLHGGLGRVLLRDGLPFAEVRDRFMHTLFGRWAARALRATNYDVKHIWTGVAEEVLRERTPGLDFVMRGSAHIRTQAHLLKTEADRVGGRVPGPSRWMIAREEREYALADRLVVLSRFAWDSFVANGVPPERLRWLPLGSDLSRFRPPAAVVEARCRRLQANHPLRVLYVGALSWQKGTWDSARIAAALPREAFHLRMVGAVTPEVGKLMRALRGNAEIVGKVPQARLREHYDWADVFIFPTVQDGYAVVLAQAAAAGLPIITTPNCSGPDFIDEGRNGWIVPIRDPQAFIERLGWCAANRSELAEMASRVYAAFKPRDWRQVAADFEALCLEGR